ncbi:MAG TPA: aminotransferase class V-fold PLP-dependent enzyme, partial [Pseudodesulfovibrio sp.]|nr:aminotransferase class V-fold PLP-dependent enzyme [Pseudodesulfovibrio sp.]
LLDRPRIAFDNAASTQVPLPVLRTFLNATAHYANVHRSAYDAARVSGMAMEGAYNTAANLVNAASWQEIVIGPNTTGMINLVALGLRNRFEDGDNVVLSELEHSSNVGPWIGLRDSLAAQRAPVRIEVRLARFDLSSGELDYNHLGSLIDSRTRIVSVTGASNFLGVKPDLIRIADMVRESGHVRPDGRRGSLFMVDGAQLVPSTHVDVQRIGCDFLAWSGHKMALPLGIGCLYARTDALNCLDHPLHGGGMYTDLFLDNECWREHPWDFTAGTPPILGIIAFGAGIKFLISTGMGYLPVEKGLSHEALVERTGRTIIIDQLLSRPRGGFPHSYAVPDHLSALWNEYTTSNPDALPPLAEAGALAATVKTAMNNITQHLRDLTAMLLDGLCEIPGVTVYGPLEADRRGGLVAFDVKGIAAPEVGMEL